MRIPVFDRSVVADIAVFRDDAAHPGGVGGLHVAQVVAEIEAVGSGDADELAGLEQRLRMRLGMGKGIAADQAGGAFGIAQCLHQRNGIAVRFVGDDAPLDAVPFQCVDQCCGVIEQLAMHADVVAVVVEKDVAQGVVVGMPRFDAETGHEQAARTVRRLRAQGSAKAAAAGRAWRVCG